MNNQPKTNKSQSIDGVFSNKGPSNISLKRQGTQKSTVHMRTQKSTTLNRKVVAKPLIEKRKISTKTSTINKSATNNKHKITRKKILTNPPKTTFDNISIDEISFDDIPMAAPPIQNNFKTPTEIRIEEQLKKADAHLNFKQKDSLKKELKNNKPRKLHPRHKKALSISFSFASLMVFMSLALLLNLPMISMAIVNKKVGFKAQMPEYTPAGYGIVSPIGYANGRVVLKFKSNSSDFSYQIEQKPTKWTTDTLKEQVTSSSGSQYLSQSLGGLTIYFTDNNTATWIDNGLLYTLKGDSGLSSDQIASIASSIK